MPQSRPSYRFRLSGRRGFTLVELVVVIVVLGVLALGVGSFIGFGTQIYVDGQQWQQHLGNVRYASQRLTRDVQNAIPGTVSVTNRCVSFNTIASSERYLAAPMANQDTQILAYRPNCCVANGANWDCSSCTNQSLVLVENYQAVTNQIASVSCQGSDCQTAVLALNNSIAAGSYSVGQRYFLVDQSVNWCVDNISGQLTRNGILMGEGLENDISQCVPSDVNNGHCPFIEIPPTLTNNNVVRWQWWVTAGGQPQQFVQEAQVINVP